MAKTKQDPKILEQKSQIKDIRETLSNLGFKRFFRLAEKNIKFGRESDIDDLFVSQNLVLLVEYTISKDAKDHLKGKGYIYKKIMEDKNGFLKYLKNKFKDFNDYIEKSNYIINELRIKILYCTKVDITEHVKNEELGLNEVIILNYNVGQYFKKLSRAIKNSGIYEFLEFLGISYSEYGENIKQSRDENPDVYRGYILPEEKCSLKQGYKIISFYMEAEALIKRAYVLRSEGWRDTDSINLYQRAISATKIKDMRKSLASGNTAFISNIIATIDEDRIQLSKEVPTIKDNKAVMKSRPITIDELGDISGIDNQNRVNHIKIKIDNDIRIIGIIDGQHRAFAYHKDLNDKNIETKISKVRDRHSLLVSAIVFPKTENRTNRAKFEASLFKEINSKQSKVKSSLLQEIELIIKPHSSTAISKRVIQELSKDGIFADIIERSSYDKGRLKTSSIVSYGLIPLLKLDKSENNSLFLMFAKDKDIRAMLLDNKNKSNEKVEKISEYISFAKNIIREIFIGVKLSVANDYQWKVIDRSNPKAIVSVTFFNGILRLLKLMIHNNKQLLNHEEYKELFVKNNISKFDFKAYKSSGYSKMGQDLYRHIFEG